MCHGGWGLSHEIPTMSEAQESKGVRATGSAMLEGSSGRQQAQNPKRVESPWM